MARDQFLRWAYRGKRPNAVAKALNRFWAICFGAGVMPSHVATLEVVGRSSGRTRSLPVVMAVLDDERYLVSMLGEGVAWVKNVRAGGGQAVLRRGRREAVVLEEVPIAERAPVIKAYLAKAPGGRPHIPVDRNAPLAEFERIAADVPVFRVRAAEGA